MVKLPYTAEQRMKRGAIDFSKDKGLTEQSHKDSCDINRIMATYAKTGQAPVVADQVPRYGDFSEVTDYQSACNLIIQAQESFDSLPALIRKEFDHDPAKFLAALEDPTQRAKLIDLGVIVETEGVDIGVSPIEPVKASKVVADDQKT